MPKRAIIVDSRFDIGSFFSSLTAVSESSRAAKFGDEAAV
jgi:hypothetical protein